MRRQELRQERVDHRDQRRLLGRPSRQGVTVDAPLAVGRRAVARDAAQGVELVAAAEGPGVGPGQADQRVDGGSDRDLPASPRGR
jgi:hypothetical protein